jgi:DNA-binding transcriptional regulator YiaG
MNIDAYRTQGTGSIAKVISSALVVASMLGTPTTGYANLQASIERTSAVPSNALFTSNSLDSTPSTARSIFAIRQLANLTWDETAKVFGVSRRSVHLWANGRHPSGDQERKLNRVLGILSAHQSLGPSMLREKLMASARPGTLFFDLLCNEEFGAFQELFSAENSTSQYPLTSQTFETARRSPPPPTLLLDALQDRPVTAGNALIKKSVRLKRQAV